MKILAVLFISAIAFPMPVLFNAYESTSYGLPNSISDCTYRGGGRREDCLYPVG
ncbi:hypothetical protein OGM63_14555 [Plectonema radiosum NIES-515]|uniref:Uncharacterized protein n=1 Tax=Plectonema radiosum NIES-515 TaxID=2986073 RepID=A0ABT3B017_9CYAN|nr:hypothetical protein [Plectonema radiosum]MCV3214722.1 hypothetical protein [Plectonema radiosum NIES-515]